jgi:MFS family permease
VPLITAALIPAYGWRGALLGLSGLVIFVSWPVVALCLREPEAGDAATKQRQARNTFGVPFSALSRESSFWVLNVAFFMLGLTATSLVSQQVPLLTEAGWSPAAARSLVTTIFGFALLIARVTVGFFMDHVFAPRVMQTVAIGGAISCILYATYPDAAIVSAILLGFLLGAEFDVLAFLIKRYYGNIAYGRAYGVIFGVFYLGSGLGITGLAWIRQLTGNYHVGLYIAAGVLVSSAILLILLPKYRFRAGEETSAKT